MTIDLDICSRNKMSLAIDSDPITTTPKLAVVTINGDGGSNAGDSTTDSVDANNRDGAGDESVSRSRVNFI